jgi:hypothetical protein
MATDSASLPPLRQLCVLAELNPEALGLLDDRVGARDFLQRLTNPPDGAAPEGEESPPALEPDAVRLLSHALPARESVWWAWASVRRVMGETPPAPVLATLAAAEAWIAKPTDANRRAAYQRAEEDGGASPAGLVALAAWLSGGSLAPSDAPEVPPPPFSAAKAVAGAVIIAAVQDPLKAGERFHDFLTQGLEVADRIQLWERFPERGAKG